MRRRIAALLVIPLVSLIGLWVFAASITLGDALQKNRHSTLSRMISQPISNGFTMVQYERAAAAVVLGTDGRVGGAELAAFEAKTNRAVAAFRARALSDEARGSVSPAVWQRVKGLVGQFDRLGPLRAKIHSGDVAPLDAIRAYGEIFDSATLVMSNLSNANDLEIYQENLAVLNVRWARDHMLRENDLMTALQASGGTMSVTEHTAFVDWAAKRRHLHDSALANLSGTLATTLDRLARSVDFSNYERLEAAVVDSISTANSRGTRVDWLTVVGPVSESWLKVATTGDTLIADKTGPLGNRIMIRLAFAGGLGLLAVAVSVLLSALFVRKISDELRRLQRAAQRLAGERLPDIVSRLRRGEDVDITAESTAELAGGYTREITSVAEAFTTVQRTAMQTAVGEAELRKGISRVFMNLAWRSQSLLHRQLKMLDAMEHRATDPDELENLFRLDHLTTRMRRHAEGLVILSGSPTVRGWNQPVPVDDLLRAALSEVEDYTRVDVITSSVSSAASLTGSVVTDVIHLTAELIENATVFSPPNTEVLVRSDIVGNGLAIEVVDRGIGMATEELAATNHRLSNPPEFDLADSDRLGLFVVGRLADRHGIRVVLQPSPYGGITAVVLVPKEHVILDDRPVGDDDGGAARPEPATKTRPPAIGRPATRQFSYQQATDEQRTHEPTMYGQTVPRPAGPGQAVHGRPLPPLPARSSSAGTGRPSPSDQPSSERLRPVRGQPGGQGRPALPTAYVDDRLGPAEEPPYGRAEQEEADGFESERTGRLPRRVRQQNLVPQLRDRRPASPAEAPPDAPGEDDDDRPELSRSLVSSLQAGWTLGRQSGDIRDDGEDGGAQRESMADHGDHERHENEGNHDATRRDK